MWKDGGKRGRCGLEELEIPWIEGVGYRLCTPTALHPGQVYLRTLPFLNSRPKA